MRIDDKIFHKLSEKNEYNVHSQSEFSHYCDMIVKHLSVSEPDSEYRVIIMVTRSMGQGFAVVERPSPFSGKLDVNEKK
jgi:hypothetical protein